MTVSGTATPCTYAERVDLAAETLRVRREAQRIVDAEDRPPQPLPRPQTLAQLLAEDEPPVAWRIDGWQPADSRVLLAAAAKTGKTTLTGGLLRSLVDGDRWLGDVDVTPIEGTVCVIDTEMSPRQLRAWLRDQHIRGTDRVLLVCLRGRVGSLDLLDPDRRAEWAALLRQHRVRYLIVDCLRPVLDACGLDESHEAGRWLVALDALLVEAGISEACLVHHMGHDAERSRGDSRLRDWPDVEWRMVRQDDQPGSPRYVAAYGRDVDVPETQLTYDPATRRLTIAGGSRRDHLTHEALGAVVEVLRASCAGLSARAIERALDDTDHGRDTIRAALRLGLTEGLLRTAEGPRRAILHQLRGGL